MVLLDLSSRLVNKHVLITGASAGIGAATAILFARAGANITLVARRADKLEQVKQSVTMAHAESGVGKGGKIQVLALDLSKLSAIDSILPSLRSAGAPNVDILINNAGGVRGVDHAGAIDPNDIDIMFDLNVKGLIHLTQVFIREFKAQNSGHIIMLGSLAGREPYAGGSIYCATKSAVRAFTGSVLRELINTPIRVSEVQPGMVETEFSIVRFGGDKSRADSVYQGLQPLTGADIAEEILWIASRPPHINIAEVFVMPVNQASAGAVYRTPKSE